MQKSLLEYFEEIKDPRSDRNKKHPLEMLIGTTLLAFLCGIDSFSGIEAFVEGHEEELAKYFDFPGGVPSHDTYQRLWDQIRPEEFVDAFHSFTASIVTIPQEMSLVSIDGKTIRNSGKEKPLHIVSAWCEANQMVIAQHKVKAKSNEITAIPELLKLLDLHERIVTVDAIGAQREICTQIVQQGGDYLIAIKGNQGNLHQDIKDYFKDSELLEQADSYTDITKGHERIEQRTAYVIDDIQWLINTHQWPSLRSIGIIVSTVTKKEKTYTENRFYISSLDRNAERFNKAARAHWGIENKLHWRLDVVFNEDKSCIRNDNASENIAIMRKWALNVIQKIKDKPEQSLKGIMRKNCMSFKHLIKSLSKIFHA
ncbi:ISAs1 family transposase [bacterium]|nr:MAG: ISAs1 family transposase [bacterium]QQR62274.1 MAG: ISAs1 family transposase [bacterium]QQR63161.1 MAG: ISAs1 family transposase [bacterium]